MMVMKRLLFILMVLLSPGLLVAPAFADGPDVTFQKGLEAYDAKEFEKAVEVFEGILIGGDVSPEVYLNLGHAYFQTGKPGMAALNYRRAERLSPKDPQIRSNLRKAVETGRRPLPKDHVIFEFVRTIPHTIYMWVMFAAFWVMMLLFCIFCFSRPGAGWWFKVGLAGLLVMAAGAYGGHLTDPQNYPDEVVVVGKKIDAKFSPNKDADKAFGMGPGAIARSIRKQDGKLEIESGKQKGWIPESAIERVTLPSPPGTSLADMVRTLLTKLK